MPQFSNLVSDSILITSTVDFLRSIGGRASAVSIVDSVMKINKPEPGLARLLVSDLATRDARLRLNDDFVEIVELDHDGIDLGQTGFVVFDLETTGAKAPPCRVTEIGAYKVVNGEVADEFHSLVNPQTPISSFITGLTGIDDEMVKDAPVFRDIADELLEFIGDSILVAHNARFDMAFLNYEIGRVYPHYRLANPSLCTVQLSRRLLPNIENHKLNTVANYYSIDLVRHHRADHDARATAHIFVNLLDMMRGLGISSFREACAFSTQKLKKDIC